MAIAVTQTKIIIPRRRNDLLSRERLNHFLDDLLDYKLLLIAAPAGYGKTSLLVDWVHQNDLPVCWYSLDPLDRDLARFINHLIASVSRVFPEFGRQSRSAFETNPGPDLDIERIITAIVNDAYENIKEHFVMVLDDFHTIDSVEKINTFVNRFVCEVDENCHIVLSSRTLLSLPHLPLMVGRSMVKGLSYDELAFQAEEIRDLLQQNYHKAIEMDTAVALQGETEGWITGLLLSAQTMWEGMKDRIQVARASGVGLYEYLAQQVLEQQPPILRDFLLKTSLLEEFDSNLCQTVFGSPPEGFTWSDLIGEVLQNNLFVLPVDDQGTWLRYHHLFRDFLQDWIIKEDWESAQTIFNTLAGVNIQQNNWGKAYEIYQRIGDEQKIMELIPLAGTSMLKNRQIDVLKGWLDNLEYHKIEHQPQLLSLVGSIDILYGRTKEGILKLDQAEDLLMDKGEPEQLALLLVRRSTGLGFLGKYQEALNDVDRALSLVKEDDKERDIYAEALHLKGLGYYRLGDLGGAIQYLTAAVQLFETLANPQNEALTHSDLGLVYMDTGDYPKAVEHLEKAYEYWDRQGNIARKVTVLNNIGVLYHREGKYDEASNGLNETLILARNIGNKRIEAYALASIGDLYAELDAYGAATEAYQLAREISIQINNQRLLIYSLLAGVYAHWKNGDTNVACELLKEVEGKIAHTDSAYERGLFLLISGKITIEKRNEIKAIEDLERAVELFTSGGQDVELIQANIYLFRACIQISDVQRGHQHLRSALNFYPRISYRHALLVALREVEDILQGENVPTDLQQKVNSLIKEVKLFKERIPTHRQAIRKQRLEISIQKSPKITILALGQSQVLLDGKLVSAPEWRTQPTVRELFFLLLAHPDGLSKEEIGLIIWPESSVYQLKVQFKNAVYRLRRALGKDIILFDNQSDTYHFNWSLDYEYDVETFWNQVNLARIKTGDERLSAYQDAVRTYQGSFLPDGEGYWIESEREQIWKANLKAEMTLARLLFSKKDYHAALVHIHQVLSVDQCQEEAHRLAMKTYAGMGNKVDLARQYEVCKTALDTMLGISPSKKTESLYHNLLSDNR